MVWIRQLVCFNYCPSQLHRVSGECIGMEHTEHEKAGGTCNFNKPRNENAGARTSITITGEQWQLRDPKERRESCRKHHRHCQKG